MSRSDAPQGERIAFLLDVDNTLLDNDRLKHDIATALRERLGGERAERFWALYEEVRQEEDFVDFPLTVRRLAEEFQDPQLAVELTEFLNAWPFKQYLYPHVMEVIAHMQGLGTVVILSDGDSVFQPRKIRDSGLAEAVHEHVLVYVHKEHELKKVFHAYPADHYVVVDDKPRIISVLERDCPTRFTTVLVLQGKYARTGEFTPPPDYVVPHIGDLRNFSREQFLASPERQTM